MTTLFSQQLDRSRSVRQMVNANAPQTHAANCPTKLHGHFHEARKIVCNNFQRTMQAYAAECQFYTSQALPLPTGRILRLAENSPMAARSPARRSSDGRETTGKKSGEMSRLKSVQLPGNGRPVATAMPPSIRQTTRKTTCHAANTGACWPRRKLVRRLATRSRNSRAAGRAMASATSRKTTRSNLNHDTQKL